ncbi:MAG: hypothetical protein A2149_06665 [Candidatus Schekmanbacteria bacterium RBG_16_38_11]|uniref:AAA+ ATPase domain-containing protein n=1 Tax=Candidatus Schekmanbacteria bacterium RBG_16_38_11 TaxID=1817880 RepID=A0A1F7RZA0_9BACT|nr:MAG: hypothetical protein A2149_06665 [Candidatus Schekmanbacteria bacterium RBG_16_38_11]
MIPIKELLELATTKRASDVLIGVNLPPLFKVDGEIIRSEFRPLGVEECQNLIFSMLTPKKVEEFVKKKEVDSSFGLNNLGRFRLNVHYQRGSVACAVKIVPNLIPDLENLGFPGIVKEFLKQKFGLVLITGPQGNGKSTTIASMIEEINLTRPSHIITIENPIEFTHKNKKSMIEQREVGPDTDSSLEALRHVRRQACDVIMLDEMSDLETIEEVLKAAELGQLILSTMHASSSADAIERIIEIFPEAKRNQIAFQLSIALQGIICQQLIPRKDGKGRVLACEIILIDKALRGLIKTGDIDEVKKYLDSGGMKGSISMRKFIEDLFRKGIVGEDSLRKKTEREYEEIS